jgi:hypothetical protein
VSRNQRTVSWFFGEPGYMPDPLHGGRTRGEASTRRPLQRLHAELIGCRTTWIGCAVSSVHFRRVAVQFGQADPPAATRLVDGLDADAPGSFVAAFSSSSVALAGRSR